MPKGIFIIPKGLNINNHVPMDIGINPWNKIRTDLFWRNFCPKGARIMTKLIDNNSVIYKIIDSENTHNNAREF
jgi:hypothetical protein